MNKLAMGSATGVRTKGRTLLGRHRRRLGQMRRKVDLYKVNSCIIDCAGRLTAECVRRLMYTWSTFRHRNPNPDGKVGDISVPQVDIVKVDLPE